MNRITRLTKCSVNRITTLGLGLLALGAVTAGPALATTVTGNLEVSAFVSTGCVINLISSLPFGTFQTVAAASLPVDQIATINFTCSLDTPYIITLGQGDHDATGLPGTPARRMVNGTTNFLDYNLYQDIGRLTVWGNTAATAPGSALALGSAQTVTVYGRIPAHTGASLQTGAYTDTVLVTITF
jgi:spore coat protein U-like protein